MLTSKRSAWHDRVGPLVYSLIGCAAGVLEGGCHAALVLLHLKQLQRHLPPPPVAKPAHDEPARAPPAASHVVSTAKPAKMLQIVLLGDSGVGKTTLLSQYMTNSHLPSAEHKPTIGAEFCTRELDIDGVKVTAQIWETAGSGPALSHRFYSGAAACVLLFDMANLQSFLSLDAWYSLVLLHTKAGSKDPPLPFMLIGHCKHDASGAPQEHKVSTKAILQWCASKGDIPYVQVGGSGTLEALDQALTSVVGSAVRCAEAGRQRSRHMQQPLPVSLTAAARA